MTVAEASTLLTAQIRATRTARADVLQVSMWLRAAMRALIAQSVELDRLRAQIQRERQQHRDLRESILLEREAA